VAAVSKVYKCRVEKDGDDLVLVLPEDLMRDEDLKPGDDITWFVRDDGVVGFRKTSAASTE